MPNGRAPTWSVQAALDMLDENRIETGILSVSSGPKLQQQTCSCVACNEAAANLRATHPKALRLVCEACRSRISRPP